MGQSFELWGVGGATRMRNPSLGGFTDSSGSANYALTDGWKFGFRTAVNSWRFFGYEFGYSYNRTKLKETISATEQGMAIHQGTFNMLAYATPEGSRVRPFATGGIHFNNYVPPGSSVTSGGGNTKIGFNYGGGVKFKISDKFGLRFDVRNYQNGKPFSFLGNRSGLIGLMEISAGFGLVI